VAREQLDPDDAGKELELLAAALWPAEDLVRQDLEAWRFRAGKVERRMTSDELRMKKYEGLKVSSSFVF